MRTRDWSQINRLVRKRFYWLNYFSDLDLLIPASTKHKAIMVHLHYCVQQWFVLFIVKYYFFMCLCLCVILYLLGGGYRETLEKQTNHKILKNYILWCMYYGMGMYSQVSFSMWASGSKLRLLGLIARQESCGVVSPDHKNLFSLLFYPGSIPQERYI